MQSLYPQSTRIKGIRWLAEPILYANSHGDLWASTWADDGHLYCISDDTQGIDKSCNSNLAIHRLMDTPPIINYRLSMQWSNMGVGAVAMGMIHGKVIASSQLTVCFM